MPTQVITLIVVGAIMFLVIGGLAFLSHYYTLDGIKSKTVGDGQHGTARWLPNRRFGRPMPMSLLNQSCGARESICRKSRALSLAAKGPKTMLQLWWTPMTSTPWSPPPAAPERPRSFCTPTFEYALASGMSFLCTDTKGDLFRNYAGIAKDCYGYQIAVLDLRNPTARTATTCFI